jgi:hypothetical protein
VIALNTATSTTATTAQTQAALNAVARTQYILSVEP